ncbi:MAG: tubulin-like doman-containing protein [Bryobacteraceae bacterium]
MASVIHRNHLIVGLGGTGGNIIRSLRKTVYQNYRQEDPPNVNLRFLYVDTSREMMEPDDPSWKILGRSVQLPERSQMHISGMNLRDVVLNLSNYPGIKPWLGSREDWSDIIGAADAANIVGGQKRRLGRFLFAGKSAEFRRRISELVREMQQHQSPNFPRSNETTFHICCGLAGGTGSGSVVDAVAQIRSLFPDAAYRIIVYALLPERNPPAQKAGVNYHGNGYAALMELNALSVGTWKPHDVTGVRTERLDLQDPFNCCYLFNDENEANVSVNVGTELPEIVSSFLFQKTVEIQNIEWGETNTLLRQETFEVGSQAKYPEKSPKGKSRRTRSFFSFGIKQIAYPEVEIREYLSYSFARQAVLQLLFNKWVDGQGYKEEAVNQSFHEFVKDKATEERWFLTDDRLTLSEGILKDEINNKNWKPVGDFWKLIVPNYVTHVLGSHKDNVEGMLPEFTKLCDAVYKEQYRGSGVGAFYETKRSDMRDQVREIRNRIEADLFADWKNGVKSMHDLSRLLAALLAAIEERLTGVDGKIVKLGEESETYKVNEAKIAENRKQWAKLNTFSIALGKHKNLLAAQAEAFILRYTFKTRIEGYRYAKDLLNGLRQELNSLASEVSRCSSLVSQAAKAFQQAIDSRLADKGNQDLTKQVVRFYDPESVKSFARSLTTELTEQKKQTGKVRARLADLLGEEKQNFTAFNSKITAGRFNDILESTCEESAIEAHEDFVARFPDRGRLLSVSLIEMLQKEYDGGEERLRGYAQNIMAMAKNYLKLDASQVQLVAPGIPAANDDSNAVCVSNLTIIAPEAAEAAEFRRKFCGALRNATTAQTQVVTNKNRPQEVTLINITNVFPARFVSVLDFLRRKYEERLQGSQGKRAFLELHSEGAEMKLGDGQELPSLFPETYQPADLYPWMLLGEALDLIRMEKDALTGVGKCFLVTTDNDGFPVAQELGPSFDQVLRSADVLAFETIQGAVEPLLNREYQHIDRRQEVLAKLRGKVQEMTKTRPATDPVFQELRAGLTRAKEILGIQ